MAHDLEQLKQDHPDVAKLFADDWLKYSKSAWTSARQSGLITGWA